MSERISNNLFVIIVCLVGFLTGHTTISAQGLNELWLSGYNSADGIPYGGARMDLAPAVPMISYEYRNMNIRTTTAVLTNAENDLLFYTNGFYTANASNDTMVNGQGLNPSFYTTDLGPGGLAIAQADLVLPSLANTDEYWLIHSTTDTIDPDAYFFSRFLYRSTVDMSLADGLGEVTQKNEIILTDTLESGGWAAVRHGNGRDWWVIGRILKSEIFVRVLLTPDTVLGPYYQTIGVWRGGYSMTGVFSSDGTQFACSDGVYDLDVFDFDRCTGELFGHRHAVIDDLPFTGTAAFSPNGELIYVTSHDRVFQYDLNAADLTQSQVTVAVWDSTYDTHPVLATYFWIARLAPDGKIYISTGNSTRYLHVIHSPDEPGLACDLVQHDIMLPTYNVNSIPYHPNYWLGPVDGSECDSLGITVGVSGRDDPMDVSLYPNPSTGDVTLNYPPQGSEGVLVILDVSGRVVHQERLSQWTSIKGFNVAALANGIYHCRLNWPDRSASVRMVIDRP